MMPGITAALIAPSGNSPTKAMAAMTPCTIRTFAAISQFTGRNGRLRIFLNGLRPWLGRLLKNRPGWLNFVYPFCTQTLPDPASWFWLLKLLPNAPPLPPGCALVFGLRLLFQIMGPPFAGWIPMGGPGGGPG